MMKRNDPNVTTRNQTNQASVKKKKIELKSRFLFLSNKSFDCELMCISILTLSNCISISYFDIEVKFSKLLLLQYFDVGMGENFNTSLGQKPVSVRGLSDNKNSRA